VSHQPTQSRCLLLRRGVVVFACWLTLLGTSDGLFAFQSALALAWAPAGGVPASPDDGDDGDAVACPEPARCPLRTRLVLLRQPLPATREASPTFLGISAPTDAPGDPAGPFPARYPPLRC
jgi:hypothetical protein